MSTSTSTNLPPEITEAVLRHLPAKSLGQFKSVSKTWHSLIANPQFIKTHLHQINTTKLILISDTKSLYSLNTNEIPPYLNNNDDVTVTAKELTFPSQQPIRWEEIIGSSNGLVLAKDEIDSIYILNPTTREIVNVPRSPFALPDRESFVMYGFGYDLSSDDYKVISISFWDTDNEHNPDCTDMFVNVFSLRNNSWHKLKNSPYDHAVGHLISGVLVNQSVHWLTSTRSNNSYSSVIVAFSLEDEEFNEVELPGSVANDKAVFSELVVVGGKLGLFGSHVGNELWVMEEYGVGESWTQVCIEGVEIDPAKPVCLVEGSDGDIVFGDEDEVFVYNVDERRRRNVRIEGGVSGFAIGDVYVESIESVKRVIRTS